MLTATDLVFRVGSRVLVNRFSQPFEPGNLHLIIGPNGAGKTTLVRLLARLLRPDSGTIEFEGSDIGRWKERDLAKVRALLSQSVEVAFPIPVSELVIMGRYPHFDTYPNETDLEICQEVMRFFNVDEFAHRNYETLSGGERQSVQFARVLAQIWRPVQGATRYLFLDEPLTFLDIRHQIDFMEKLRTFASQRGVTVVGVVHDLNLAAQFADRLLLLNHGEILAVGTADEVLSEEHLRTAFDIAPIQLTNSATGKIHLVYESNRGGAGPRR